MPTPSPEAPWGPSPSTRLAGATPTPQAGTGHRLSPGLRCQSPRPTLLPPRPALPAPPAVGMFCRWLSELTVTLTPSRPHVLCDLLYLPPPSRPLAPTCSMTAAARSCRPRNPVVWAGKDRQTPWLHHQESSRRGKGFQIPYGSVFSFPLGPTKRLQDGDSGCVCPD